MTDRDLLKDAENSTAQPSRSGRVNWKAVIPAVQVLRDEKGYTWAEVVLWLKERGIQTSKASAGLAYKRHFGSGKSKS